MKIAVASENGKVAQHFGHCETFMTFDTAQGQIVQSEAVANPGHKPGFLPNFLNDQGVNVIISGGMGGGALNRFQQKDIEVIIGAAGDVRDAVQRYLAGELVSTDSVCEGHQHRHNCRH
jgi:predicted Fe-Mo cluster-binding NifX family protein